MNSPLLRNFRIAALSAVAVTLWACESAPPTAPATPVPQKPALDVILPGGAPLGDGKLYVCKYGTDASFHITVKDVNGVVVKTFTPTVTNGQCNLIDFQLHQFPLFVATVTEDPMPNVHVDIIRKDTIVGQAVSTQLITGTSTVVTSYGLEVGSTLEFYNTVLTPDVSISKTADAGTVNAGETIGFTITVTNNGTGTASNTTISDPLPTTTGVSWSVDAANSDPTCAIVSNTLSCDFGDIAAGGSKKVHVTSPTTQASCAVLNNTATLNNDPTKTASATISVLCPSLTIAKTADAALVSAGSPIGFVVTVSNIGAGSASNVTVSDPLPAGSGISWSVDAANSDPTCSISANLLSCNFGTLASGASKKVHVTSPTTTASCGTYDNTATLVLDNPKTASASVTVQCPTVCTAVSTINSNFNGTAIAAGRYIWFNSVMKVKNVPSTGAVLQFTSSSVTFPAAGTVSVPNAKVTFSPSAAQATTTFNTVTNTWETVVPVTYTGNVFLAGLSYPVLANIPGGQNPVSWTGNFSSNVPGLTVNWQWAAAVYTSFSTNYSSLGVKPVDSNNLSAYLNSDHAGTPENFKSFVTGGARGGGGSNFTGSYSGTGSVAPCN